jgi:hypothetical protein
MPDCLALLVCQVIPMRDFAGVSAATMDAVTKFGFGQNGRSFISQSVL